MKFRDGSKKDIAFKSFELKLETETMTVVQNDISVAPGPGLIFLPDKRMC